MIKKLIVFVCVLALGIFVANYNMSGNIYRYESPNGTVIFQYNN